MVTIATARLPPPKSWSEFEDICRDAFGERWSNTNLTKHGRSGQGQQGVDIYGDDHRGQTVGIQCKNTVGAVTMAMITAEVTNAEEFDPPIATLYIASACDTDAPLQQLVRTLSQSRIAQAKFGVEIVSWPEIAHDLAKNPALAAKHFPQMFSGGVVSSANTKRNRDLQNLKRLLDVIDLDSVNGYLTWGAKYIHSSVEDHLDQITAVRNSPSFALSDNQLLQKIDHLVSQWYELRRRMSFAQYDLSPNGMLLFYMPGDACRTPEEKKAYDAINLQLGVLQAALHAFSDEIKQNYLEIDLAETSKNARRRYA